VPVVIVGLAFGSRIEDAVRTPGIAAAMLAAGAVLLLAAERFGRRTRDASSVGAGEAFAIGIAQAAALVPGVSRSGATMTVGMLAGLRRDAAAKFSFLLGVPAIVAAAAHEGLALWRAGMTASQGTLFLLGIAVSGIVGYLTIKYLLKYLAAHTLAVFAWYRLALAATVAVWLWSGRG
jgi:undecaprenyl-diphosphatase